MQCDPAFTFQGCKTFVVVFNKVGIAVRACKSLTSASSYIFTLFTAANCYILPRREIITTEEDDVSSKADLQHMSTIMEFRSCLHVGTMSPRPHE